jgi:thiosulfate/3-mercaptopyruvate sulfurtransferase
MTEYANADSLVDIDWLEANVHDPGITLIEVDEDTAAYEKGHIRNALAWDWNRDLHAQVGRDYVDREGLSALLQQAGVGPETTVVLYGGNNNWFAAYAYWILKLRGFDNVKLLNGGRKKWELESKELTQETPSVTATDFQIQGPESSEIRAFRDEIIGKLDAVQGGGAALIDVRSPEEYRGEKLAPDHLPQEQAQVPGHIP